MSPTGELRVWRDEDACWRWAYSESELEIAGNQAHTTRAGATEAARTAYPDVPLAGVNGIDRPGGRRASLPALALGVLALVRAYLRGRR